MLAITTYDPSYVDACRKRVNALLGKYRKLEKAAAGVDGFGKLAAAFFAEIERKYVGA